MEKPVLRTIKNIYHLANACLACFWYGFPAKKLKVIGITGTNGKTTTVQMVAKILEKAGHKTAVSSSINFQLGKKKWVNKTKFTTLSSWHVQKFIFQAVKADCGYLVLEVSSHALDQNRVWGICFDAAVVTNVTREHLDYHRTMERYRAAKLKLFKKIKKEGAGIVNLDMKKPEDFLEEWEGEKYGYCAETQNSKRKIQKGNPKLKIIMAKSIKFGLRDSKFYLDNKKFELNLPGIFNVENVLAAVCVGLSQGIGLEIIVEAVKEIKKIPGRMDWVENDKGLEIIIDYAVTPDSMKKLGELVTQNLLSTENSRLIWVFGSCGQRDRGKRPIIGKIVSKYADFAIVTNEDPYDEDPRQIIDEVFAGLLQGGKKEKKNAWKIFDRKHAIKKALDLAQSFDIILITGKGAEETMAIGKKRIPWNDRKIVLELVGKI